MKLGGTICKLTEACLWQVRCCLDRSHANTPTVHTHTHKQTQRKREREREASKLSLDIIVNSLSFRTILIRRRRPYRIIYTIMCMLYCSRRLLNKEFLKISYHKILAGKLLVKIVTNVITRVKYSLLIVTWICPKCLARRDFSNGMSPASDRIDHADFDGYYCFFSYWCHYILIWSSKH